MSVAQLKAYPREAYNVKRANISASSQTCNDGLYRASQDNEVQPDRPVAHVIGNHRYSLFVANIAASAHLPEPRHTRSHPPVQVIRFTVLGYLLDQHRPWPNQAHLPAQNIPELRQLVQ